VRTLTNADLPWPYSTETTDTRPRPATEELAARLGVKPGVMLHHETMECLDRAAFGDDRVVVVAG
ncbi:hypothetical protein I3W98_38960, partial [Streptomyces cavourensis]|nr:hypothetical protein [Streptomyces cavourensis]